MFHSQDHSLSKKRAQSANKMAGQRINQKGSNFHQSQNFYGKIMKHELESTGAHYLSRAQINEAVSANQSLNTKPSSRKIGERYIPAIDLKENLSPHVAYSSSMEARKL